MPFSVLGLTPDSRPGDVLGMITAAKIRPDIVHTLLLTASLYGRFAAILARVPIIVGHRGEHLRAQAARTRVVERLLMGEPIPWRSPRECGAPVH